MFSAQDLYDGETECINMQLKYHVSNHWHSYGCVRHLAEAIPTVFTANTCSCDMPAAGSHIG